MDTVSIDSMTIREKPESLLPLSADTMAILLAVASAPQHGYGIIQDVAERSDGALRLQTGALYRSIKRMLADGVIEECEAPRTVAQADPRRRYYRATAFGRAVLVAEADRMARLVRAVRLTTAGKRPRLA